MWSWRYNKELKEKYFAEYCKTQSQTKYLMYTYYERNTDAEAKELQKIGLLDKYRNYTFWDNFPDNWKLSDEELEAISRCKFSLTSFFCPLFLIISIIFL